MTLSTENQRVFIWAALALALFLNYMAWQRDYPAAPSARPANAPAVTNDTLPELPSTAAPTAQPVTPAAPAPTTTSAAGAAPLIRVRTDVLDLTISTRGGEFVRAALPKYPVEKDKPDVPVQLFDTTPPGIFVARSGLRSAQGQPQPTHQTLFEAAQTEYQLTSGANELRVPLTWTDPSGLRVTKTYTFRPGSYLIDLSYQVENTSQTPWPAASYVQLVRHYEPVERSMFDVESYAYRGPAIYDGKGYRRLDVEDEEENRYSAQVTNGWIAALQHHFVAAAVPGSNSAHTYQLSVNEANDFVLSYVSQLQTVAPGTTATFKETLFVGPKLQAQLEQAHPELTLTADYGMLTILAQPLFWLLEKVFEFVRNWGLSIIIVTFLLKLVFYRLTAAGYRSMAKMRAVAPRIKSIQERFKDDREQLGRAMMELYKREKINPFGGCLPMLVQIPVFLAFYWVLLESVEMRQAPFAGWITDLSARDPFFILPIIMGGAMFLQFKMTPTPTADPMQAKIFAFMPIVMTVMMMWFPAGLVLYWTTNTLLSIAQQWRINQVVAKSEAKA